MIRTKNFYFIIFGLLYSASSLAVAGKFELRAAYQYAPQSYTLSGEGFTAETGLITGSGMSADIIWTREEKIYSFEYASLNYINDAPAGVTPSSVNSGFLRYLFNVESTKQGADINWRCNYGLDIRQRTADRTSPSVYISESYTAGAHFGMSRDVPHNDRSRFNYGGGIFIPLYHDEQTSKTGHYRFSLNPDFHALAVHKISDSVEISIGIEILYQRISYSATGERGTTNGEESFLNIQIPLELRYQF